MSRFSIRYPYLILVLCLITCVVGVTSLVQPELLLEVEVVAAIAAAKKKKKR